MLVYVNRRNSDVEIPSLDDDDDKEMINRLSSKVNENKNGDNKLLFTPCHLERF